MSSLDVEALLDAAAKRPEAENQHSTPGDDVDRNASRDEKHGRRDREREGSGPRDRDRDYDRRRRDRRDSPARSRRGTPDEGTPRSDAGSHKSRRRSKSRDDERRHSRRSRDGDYYRGGRGGRSRSRSPYHRSYRRDDHRDRRDRSDRYSQDHGRHRDDRRHDSKRDDGPPQLTEDERDRRTVFVQQLAARLRTKELKEFFEKVGPVNEAQIVKDRVSQRSKGVGYVEFKEEESVAKALGLTGQKLLGIPVIVQVTEAEKNRQARNPEAATQSSSIPFHRLYVGNIHFNVTEEDLRAVFEPFGELEFVQLQKDENKRSRGYGFVQYRDAGQAREALEKMNGFDLAGRPIRVGLGNDKFTPESTANLLQRFSGQNQNFQGSAFSGSGGRGNQHSTFDRAGTRDSEKTGGASALDDTDVAGVNFNNYSRDALMRKLARTDESSTNTHDDRQALKPKTETKPLPVNVNMASRCVVLHNMFDPEEEEGDDWVKELEDDIRQEAEKKYGHVVHISVDPNSKGDVYLKFDRVQGGENAIKGLNGRYFGGRMIDASPVVDAVYSSLFSRTRAI
ncbi:linker between RRM2 and RRM3 domains in RBM39 protein-domain-containing protein [Stachybotrys elegans]|uniref:Linker between RRM2 and RRM3 domains in RBM39 protein-domain-containing protein n=1 Tax=Stachybotrys elegans TaxID=80388 RepID=A0A8K0WS92_9HYPO|nr:linker between RRM2 and RRM3 domains in RBM39 protein-domain-containing protein [Stachybotrys elegans]